MQRDINSIHWVANKDFVELELELELELRTYLFFPFFSFFCTYELNLKFELTNLT